MGINIDSLCSLVFLLHVLPKQQNIAIYKAQIKQIKMHKLLLTTFPQQSSAAIVIFNTRPLPQSVSPKHMHDNFILSIAYN